MLKSKILTMVMGTVVGGVISFNLIGAHTFTGTQDLQKAQDNIAKYQQEVESNTISLKDMIKGKNDLIESHTNKIHNLITERDGYIDTIGEFTAKVSNLRKDNETKDGQIKSIMLERDNKVKELNDLYAQRKHDVEVMNDLAKKVNELEKLGQDKDKEISAYKTKIDQYKSDIIEKDSLLKNYEENYKEAQKRIDQLVFTYKENQNTINNLKTKIQSLEKQVDESKNQATENNNNMEAQQAEMKKANTNVDVANKACKDFVKQTSNLKAPSIADVK